MKNRIAKAIAIPLSTIMLLFLSFVSLVNTSPEFVYACSKIPFTSDLSKVFCISESMKAMLDNDFGIELMVKQSDNGISLTLNQYVICNNNIYFIGDIETINNKDLAYVTNIYLKNGHNIYSGSPTYCNITDNKGYFALSLEDIPCMYSPENLIDGSKLQLSINVQFKEIDDKLEYFNKEVLNFKQNEFSSTSNITIPIVVDINKNIVNMQYIDFSKEIEVDNQKLIFSNAVISPSYIQIDVE